MLQDLVTQFSQRLVHVTEQLLDCSEGSLQVDLLDSSVGLESLVYHIDRKVSNLGILAAESLYELGVDDRGLVPSEHGKQYLQGDVFEVRLVCLHFLEQEVVGGEGHRLDCCSEAHVRVQAKQGFVCCHQVSVLNHLLQKWTVGVEVNHELVLVLSMQRLFSAKPLTCLVSSVVTVEELVNLFERL
jgi:hypothetical protein